MNMHKFAVLISKYEGKKVNLSIAQIKEVLKITCILMFKHPIVIAKMIINGERNSK